MAENKTQKTKASVSAFLNAVPNETRRADAKKIAKIMAEITGEKAALWGPSIIGFGQYHYKYDSGREGDMCKLGFSPRAAKLVLYVLTGAKDEAVLLKKLGKHKTSKACLYINKLADLDEAVLRDLIAKGWANMTSRYG